MSNLLKRFSKYFKEEFIFVLKDFFFPLTWLFSTLFSNEKDEKKLYLILYIRDVSTNRIIFSSLNPFKRSSKPDGGIYPLAFPLDESPFSSLEDVLDTARHFVYLNFGIELFPIHYTFVNESLKPINDLDFKVVNIYLQPEDFTHITDNFTGVVLVPQSKLNLSADSNIFFKWALETANNQPLNGA